MSNTRTDKGFKNSLDHLLAEINRIELILILAAARINPGNNRAAVDSYYNNYLPAFDVESILSTTFNRPAVNFDVDTLKLSLHEMESDISLKNQESQRAGVRLHLCELQKSFGLSAFEIDIILLCLLPELDSRFERYFAYLHDDITKKLPTIGIIFKLLCTGLEDTFKAKLAFYPHAPLIKNNLIHISNGLDQNTATLVFKTVWIDDRIVDYLTGQNLIDHQLSSFTCLCQPKISIQELILPHDLKDRLSRFTVHNKNMAPVYFFHGVPGVGKKTIAEAVCHESGLGLLYVDTKHMLNADISTENSIPLVFREGRFQNAAIYFDNSDLLLNSDSSDLYRGQKALISELEDYPYVCFLSSNNAMQPVYNPRERLAVTIEFPFPAFSERKQLWQRQLHGDVTLADDIDLDSLASKFRLTTGQIAGALSIARGLANWRDPDEGRITGNDLYFACRQQSRQKLNTLARQIGSEYTWDDIILPRDQKDQLVEICNQVRHSNTVYNEWGFGRKLSRGKGLNIIFSGPSGTGKTMAAEIMGNELSIDLYKIDLSSIVSKYIGETEKNLERIFREGITSNAIIFFDEADSLFGKRSEVRDSHDRYANIEISYLLQKMEEYDGVIILATNLRKNIDEAFARRMHFAIDFPIPEEPDRYRIWESIFPETAPIGQDVDLHFLARQFTITGGNIRNIVLASAFLAAQNGGLITMENVIRATKREFQKIGKLCTENDFAQYFNLVKG